MINKITFSGRETMLTKGLENNAEKGTKAAYEYLGAGKVFENAQASKISKVADSYTSPFNPTGKIAQQDSFQAEAAKLAEKAKYAKEESLAGKSYALSHGTPEQNINILA